MGSTLVALFTSTSQLSSTVTNVGSSCGMQPTGMSGSGMQPEMSGSGMQPPEMSGSMPSPPF